MNMMHVDSKQHSKSTLINSLQSDRSHHVMLNNYLLIYGLLWPPHNNIIISWEVVLNIVWNMIIRIILFINLVIVLHNITKHYEQLLITWRSFFKWNLDIIFICQIIILSSSLIAIDRKLNSITSNIEVECYVSMFKYSILYMMVSVVPIIFNAYRTIFMYGLAINDIISFYMFILSELLMVGYLSIQLLFVLVDMKMKMMIILKDVETTMTYVNYSSDVMRQEIKYRMKLSLHELIPILLASIVEVIMILFIYMYDYINITHFDVYLVLYCFKELSFIAIIAIMSCIHLFNACYTL